MRECVPIAFGERLAFLTHSRTSCHSPHLRLPTRIARSRGAVQSPGIFRPEPRGLERRGFKTARSINPSILESRRPARSSSRSPASERTDVSRAGGKTDGPSRDSPSFSTVDAGSRFRGGVHSRRRAGDARGARTRRSWLASAGVRGHTRGVARGGRRRAGLGRGRAGARRGRTPREKKKAPPAPDGGVTSAGQDGVELARGRARPPRGR